MIPDTRIYAQMRPDSAGRKLLHDVQGSLPPQKTGRMITDEELHMTLIHFGKSKEIFERLSATTKLDRKTYERELQNYINETSTLLPDTPFTLRFIGYELLGKNQTTLVAAFDACEGLHMLHTKLYSLLMGFFERVGFSDPLDFMEQDGNFRHAGSLHPHVTLYKGYSGALPTATIDEIHMTPMKVVY
jgi:hypothetical protein